MRVVLLKGQSQYGAGRTFIDEAAAAFAAAGVKADVVDLAPDATSDLWGTAAEAAARGQARLVFSINFGGEAQSPQGRTFAEIFAAPHVVWHTDYAFSQVERIEQTPATTPLLFVDPTQVEGVRSVFGPRRFERLGFLPHAAVGEPAPDEADAAEFERKRPIPLLWSGSFQKPRERPWAGADPITRRVFDDALDLALSVEWMPPLEALDAVLAARGLDLSDPENRGARAAAAHVDIQVRVTRRFEFLKALARSGLPVHICGVGWESDLYRFKRATYEGAVPMTRMAELMRSARVVLNTNGNFGAGSHERPFSALLAGAAVFSDYSRYYGEVFQEGRDITLFRWKALGQGIEALAELSSSPEAAFERARAGKTRVLADHTWRSRTDLILRAAESGRVEAAA